MTTPDIVYLHGFASSPGSNKARAFVERVGPAGWRVEIPRLDGGDFSTLTLTGALERVEAAARRLGPRHAVVGSSMGGWLALAHAARHRPFAAVVMAPAIDFPVSWERWLGPEGLARWAATGWLDVDHHETGRVERISYGIVEDARRYAEGLPAPECPVLIFHGRRDDVVPCSLSETFAATQPNVTLRLLDDDHQLLASVPTILDESVAFLERAFTRG